MLRKLKQTVLYVYYEVLRFRQFLIGPFLFKRPLYEKKYKIAICGIFKNEARFLKEWIDYHRLIGVEHFFLYNNNSSDHYDVVLHSYIEAGIVTLTEWPYSQGQLSAYKHFHDNYWNETQWVSFLDIDEFFVPKKDKSLLDWIKRHDKNPVNLIYWRMFGSGGALEHDDDKPVIEQYISCWPALVRCGKCIINTDYTIHTFDASVLHGTLVKRPKSTIAIHPVNQYGHIIVREQETIIDSMNSDSTDIQINHYWSKSWDIYKAKKEREGDAYFKENPKNNISYFLKNEIRNVHSDISIQRFLLPLKWIMVNDSVVSEIGTFFKDAKLK